MKSIILVTLIAAATVSAQISALPACAVSLLFLHQTQTHHRHSNANSCFSQITCGAQAAVATPCKDPSDINCTCQLSNQAIIYPILSTCLASTCTNPADISGMSSLSLPLHFTHIHTHSSSTFNLTALTNTYVQPRLPLEKASVPVLRKLLLPPVSPSCLL